jgi:isocitrate dehydrogenase
MAAEHCPSLPKSLILLHSEADDSTNQMFSLLEDAIIKKYGEEAAANLRSYLLSQNCLTEYNSEISSSTSHSASSSRTTSRKSSILNDGIGIENFDEELTCCVSF